MKRSNRWWIACVVSAIVTQIIVAITTSYDMWDWQWWALSVSATASWMCGLEANK